MSCNCITKIDDLLGEHNTVLVSTLFDTPRRVAVATDKRDSKKRGRPKIVVASYCPFCGLAYEPQPASRGANADGLQ